MNGYTMIADRVASLLPKTTAGACIPPDPWSVSKFSRVGPAESCRYVRTCHYSCHGATVCGAWTLDTCWHF
jgi:hypothetical protein